MSDTVRYALRSLLRTPLTSLVIVGCVGLGTGATTTVYTWMDHLVRRPLPAISSIERLVSVVTQVNGVEGSVSYPEYLDWQRELTTVDGLAAFGIRQLGVRQAAGAVEDAQPTWGVLATDNYFSVLGIQAAAGRAFLPGESRSAGSAPVAVISHKLAARFGGVPTAVGQQIRVNEQPFTIIGVLGSDFTGTFAGLAFDIWIPITMHASVTGDTVSLESRSARWLQAIGRLDERASLHDARAELGSVTERIARAFPAGESRIAAVKPLDTGAAQRLARLFTVLLGLASLIGLIICTNVANLLMLRGSARSAEMGIRLSLGASRGRLLGQLLVESVLLGAGGAAAGLLAAWWAQGLLPALMPPSTLPLSLHPVWDARTFAFAAAIASAMVLVFGIAPSLATIRRAVLPNIGRTVADSTRSQARLRSALVVLQLALSMAALACAGAFLRTNNNLAAMDRGLRQPEQVFIVATELEQAAYVTDEARTEVTDRLLAQLRTLPGVNAAAFATFVPLGFTGYSHVDVEVPNYMPERGEDMGILANRVSPGYFTTLGIAIVDGRAIDERDTRSSRDVVVVNQAFVRRFLPSAPAVGQDLGIGARRATIVGVAADGKYEFDALDEPARPHVYLSYAQQSRGSVTFHVRTAGDPYSVWAPLRAIFRAVNPALPLTNPTTLDDYTSLPLFPVRLGTAVLTALGTLALLLSSMGLYGVLAFRVAQRRKELALRMALGAAAARVLRLVLAEGLRQAFAGVLAGTFFGLLATRVIAARLPRLHSTDASVIAGAACVLLAVTFIASLLPAIRATAVEPSAALRGE